MAQEGFGGDIGRHIFVLANENRLHGLFQFATVLFAFLFVLLLTWVSTRLLARYQQKVQTGKNIRVIESLRVEGTKLIHIIAIGESYYAVGTGKDEMTLIGRLDENEIKLTSQENMPSLQGDFKEILEKLKGKRTGKQVK